MLRSGHVLAAVVALLLPLLQSWVAVFLQIACFWVWGCSGWHPVQCLCWDNGLCCGYSRDVGVRLLSALPLGAPGLCLVQGE